MTRVCSIWLPRLAIERWAKAGSAPPEAAVVLVVEAAHGPMIHAATAAAIARGARVGGRLTDARALDPALAAIAADPAGDSALLARLARWASRWSPLVEVDGADSLRLDTGGLAHLFGGEAALLGDIQRRFAALGLTARPAIAATAGAAWALAHYAPSPRRGEGDSAQLSGVRGIGDRRHDGSPSPTPLPAGERDLSVLLAPLPVAALRLDPRPVQILHRLGLKTIGDLAGVPRKALARRFREADNAKNRTITNGSIFGVLDALDRALGRKPEPLAATPCPPPPRALLRLAEPATHEEAAAQALDRLIPALVGELERRGLGARRLALTGYRVDGSVVVAAVATAIASRDPAHLHRLLRDRAALDPGFGFDGFVLEASWSEPLAAAQPSLVEQPDGEGAVARLVDRLSVKLGAERVSRPLPVASHVPERASGWGEAVPPRNGEGGGGGGRASKPPPPPAAVPLPVPGRMRPPRLLDRPEAIAVIYATPEGLPRRFVWRRCVHDIARAEGPERIAPEWWRERSTARLRDYYRVEDSAGRRYWIFRQGVAGDGRGGAPLWFLHGLFG